MTTHKEFLQAYSNKTDGDMRVCEICGEKHSPFIDASNPIDVVFLCHTHWRERDKLKDIESRQTVARQT